MDMDNSSNRPMHAPTGALVLLGKLLTFRVEQVNGLTNDTSVSTDQRVRVKSCCIYSDMRPSYTCGTDRSEPQHFSTLFHTLKQ